jgi:hypothetical protein
MWSSIDETTGIASGDNAVVAGAETPDAAFCASFHFLYSGLSFIIPLIFTYFLGAADMVDAFVIVVVEVYVVDVIYLIVVCLFCCFC